MFVYGTSKYAVVGLCECYRLKLAPSGIEVSVLLPGPLRARTEAILAAMPAEPGSAGPAEAGAATSG